MVFGLSIRTWPMISVAARRSICNHLVDGISDLPAVHQMFQYTPIRLTTATLTPQKRLDSYV